MNGMPYKWTPRLRETTTKTLQTGRKVWIFRAFCIYRHIVVFALSHHHRRHLRKAIKSFTYFRAEEQWVFDCFYDVEKEEKSLIRGPCGRVDTYTLHGKMSTKQPDWFEAVGKWDLSLLHGLLRPESTHLKREEKDKWCRDKFFFVIATQTPTANFIIDESRKSERKQREKLIFSENVLLFFSFP